jgi:hypothetical protein
MSLRQIPVATGLVLFFTQFGGGLALAVGQAVIVNHLFPAMQLIDPNVTIPEIVAAGATGLKDLVSPAQLPAVLIAYAESIDLGVFVTSAVLGGLAFLTAFGVEWKNVKKEAKKGPEFGKDKDADAEEEV